MTPTRYDIYVRQGGRWRRHEELTGVEKEAAVLRSSELDGGGEFDGVRAMAVVEYGAGRAPLETLAWISPHLNKMAAVKRQMANSAAAAGKAATPPEAAAVENVASVKSLVEEQGPSATPTAPSSTANKPSDQPPVNIPDGNEDMRALGKILGAGAIALGITAVLFVPVSALIRNFGPNFGLAGAGVQNAIFGISVLIFVLTATFLMVRVYREYRALIDRIAAYEAPEEPVSAVRRQQPDIVDLPRRPQSEASPVPDAQDTDSGDDSAGATDESGAREDTDADAASSVPPGGGLTEQMRRAVLQFLASALAAIKDEVPKMNQHVNFGLNLFGAGAAERYGEHAGLKRMQAFVLVREVIGALGNSEERVDAFCRNYEQYRTEERYRMMINAGRATMAKSIEGDSTPFADFADVLNMWTSDSAARAQAQGIVCIMFTDLVGSTQMTHERGDYGAQEIVRIHNAIVRTALAGHHGREVKHTGDGIMASFTSAANAVRAGMQIRESLETHNARNDALQVRVRMGLNAGEAVQEEDDFFGTTVQLAARVCDKAGEGEIFVTGNVLELSKGQGVELLEAGKFEMKGVPEPMTLYRVGASTVSD
ncbi:adenylate/guanylate cyclase domain-containing protein [Thalassospiraceae bacterium LMO-JJ14]|nr:adenylate/guanylate cyclase domain-containing protein [Thalassospiraceae bacterium LMO-JJ14]